MKYGLDFGTTNSAIAIKDQASGKVLFIDQDAVDARVIRSLLYFLRRELKYNKNFSKARIRLGLFKAGDIYYEGEQKVLIGQKAVDQYMSENTNRHPGITRDIYTGRMIVSGDVKVPEFYTEVDYGTGRLIQALKTALKSPYYKGTNAFGKFHTLEELIGIFVGEIKKKADKVIGEEINEVVCGRPVHFLDDPVKDKVAQDRLEQGLKLAGFKKITFEYEPVAAAKQFLADLSKEQLVFVFDFGGGTLDTAVVRSGENFEVLSADGTYIGGDLLNSDIMEHKLWPYFGSKGLWGDEQLPMPIHFYEALNSWFSIPNLNNPKIMEQFEKLKYKNSDVLGLERFVHLIKANLGFDLYEAIERSKKELSEREESRIAFADGPIAIDVKISRLEFEKIIEGRVAEIGRVVEGTLSSAMIKPDQVDVVVRTGGSSLIPIFEDLLVKIFGKSKLTQFETFTSIAAGLALEN